MDDRQPMSHGPVVVAVNGTPASLAALEWAIDYAASRQAPLQVVTAVSPNTAPVSDYADRAAIASQENRVKTAIDRHLGSRRAQYRHIIDTGSIVSILREHSQYAQLVVVGTRPQNRWQRLLRSSTTDRITGSVECPVVSIPCPGKTRSEKDVQAAARAPEPEGAF